jgi:prevent-host-death family protein
MKSIGIRELRQNASRYLRDTELGETIEITDRGRPLARLVPIECGVGSIGRLVAAGRLTPASRDLLEDGPIEPVNGVRPPSRALADNRADER